MLDALRAQTTLKASPAATTEVPKKVNDIEGEWKLTDIRNSIQSVYSLFEIDEVQFGYFLTIFDDLDMRLKVNGDKVEVSYSTDLNNFSNNLYKGTNEKNLLKFSGQTYLNVRKNWQINTRQIKPHWM